jgi:hypothetical protein
MQNAHILCAMPVVVAAALGDSAADEALAATLLAPPPDTWAANTRGLCDAALPGTGRLAAVTSDGGGGGVLGFKARPLGSAQQHTCSLGIFERLPLCIPILRKQGASCAYLTVTYRRLQAPSGTHPHRGSPARAAASPPLALAVPRACSPVTAPLRHAA